MVANGFFRPSALYPGFERRYIAVTVIDRANGGENNANHGRRGVGFEILNETKRRAIFVMLNTYTRYVLGPLWPAYIVRIRSTRVT